MEKVIVIGSPGAGKSTFARKLRDATGLPLYYLDRIWHRPDQTTCSQDTFDSALYEIVKRDRWIIDGNYQRTLPLRLKACDTVFLLDVPLEDCLSGAQSRIGIQREDLPWVETEFEASFRQEILDFPHKQLPQIYALLEPYQAHKTVVIFNTRADGARYLAQLESDRHGAGQP